MAVLPDLQLLIWNSCAGGFWEQKQQQAREKQRRQQRPAPPPAVVPCGGFRCHGNGGCLLPRTSRGVRRPVKGGCGRRGGE